MAKTKVFYYDLKVIPITEFGKYLKDSEEIAIFISKIVPENWPRLINVAL